MNNIAEQVISSWVNSDLTLELIFKYDKKNYCAVFEPDVYYEHVNEDGVTVASHRKWWETRRLTNVFSVKKVNTMDEWKMETSFVRINNLSDEDSESENTIYDNMRESIYLVYGSNTISNSNMNDCIKMLRENGYIFE